MLQCFVHWETTIDFHASESIHLHLSAAIINSRTQRIKISTIPWEASFLRQELNRYSVNVCCVSTGVCRVSLRTRLVFFTSRWHIIINYLRFQARSRISLLTADDAASTMNHPISSWESGTMTRVQLWQKWFERGNNLLLPIHCRYLVQSLLSLRLIINGVRSVVYIYSTFSLR